MVIIMQDLVNNTGSNAAQTMSSREIAELMGKNHYDVMKDVRRMLEKLYEGNTADVLYQQNQALTVEYCPQTKRAACYHLDRYHTEILITGYDVKRRAAVIKRWYELESGEAKPVVAHVQSEQPKLQKEDLEPGLFIINKAIEYGNLPSSDKLKMLSSLTNGTAALGGEIREISKRLAEEESASTIPAAKEPSQEDLPLNRNIASMTCLLANRKMKASSFVVNEMLSSKGLIYRTRSPKTGKPCWSITDKGLWFGRNTCEGRAHTPQWYMERFDDLLSFIGLDQKMAETKH